ncbi:MAG: DUF3825 domain-containing protein [Desulfotalea sp.]
MKEGKFNIIIKGIQQGNSAEDVIDSLSKLFNSDKSKFEALKKDRHLPVGRNLNAENAHKYESALLKAGCIVAIEQIPSKKNQTLSEKSEGVVDFFTDKGWGKINLLDSEEKLFVHFSKIIGSKNLTKGEKVFFNIIDTDKGRNAIDVERPDMMKGEVLKFVHGNGIIKEMTSGRTYKANFKNIVAPNVRMKKLYTHEDVEFFLTNDKKYGEIAVNIVRMDPRSPFDKLFGFNNFEKAIHKLSGLAQKESWDYENENSQYKQPVLQSYIRHTFNQLNEQGKILEGVDNRGNKIALLNTALVTPFQEEIFAYFLKNSRSKTEWVFENFYKDSDHKLSTFGTRPEIATYFGNPSDLLYDTRINLVVNKEHIIRENIKRFPKEVQDYTTHAVVALLEGQIMQAQKRVRRNYKTAVPQFHNGSIQLLLPLCLTTQDKADLALVVSMENEVYRGSTILTLDMAYNNARLLARPDREWLDP